MLSGLTGFHLLILVAVILMIFGATKLPVFAKSLGQSVTILRGELRPSAPARPDTDPVATEPAAVRTSTEP